jgi:hypothetical protein
VNRSLEETYAVVLLSVLIFSCNCFAMESLKLDAHSDEILEVRMLMHFDIWNLTATLIEHSKLDYLEQNILN